MPYLDFSQDVLERYAPEPFVKEDFDAFWKQTLDEARGAAFPARIQEYDAGLTAQEVFDVTFSGYAGQPIKAWLILPRVRSDRLPVVVEFIGYGGGRGLPLDWLLYSSAGYAHFVMDTRGQGGTWSAGDTPDVCDLPGSPQAPGFMTRGILDPESYYYRRVFTDAVRAVETAAAHPAVDRDRIAVAGGSQGGGISIAAAALAPALVKAAMPDVPFLCHYRRALEVTDNYPYHEIRQFCMNHRDAVDRVFTTLSYFDGLNFAPRARARALFSVGLMDQTCPPSTVYAAYNRWAGEKEIRVYPYNDHEGGQCFHARERLSFLKRALG
jgi:cephalosporin-C deacetylase